MTWNDIPMLAVITGRNGSGKSHLLEFINQLPGNQFTRQKDPSIKKLAGRIKYIDIKFDPSSIGEREDQNTFLEIRKLNKLIIDTVRNKSDIQNKEAINPIISRMETAAGKALKELSDDDLISLVPPDAIMEMSDNFNNQYITKVFLSYNQKIRDLKLSLYDRGEIKSSDELETIIGHPPPWKIINDEFSRFGFNYFMNPPKDGVAFSPLFEDREQNFTTDFKSLSSGEKIIVSLILWSYNSFLGSRSDLFLFDEIDAHLNPSMARMAMAIIKEKIIDGFGIQVIMTTHSPSTVAFTPNESLFWMDRGQEISKIDKSTAISVLSDGFVALENDTALRILVDPSEVVQRPVVFVEGKTDRDIIEIGWKKLHPTERIPFLIQDAFDAYFVANIMKRGDIFSNYKDMVAIGILDFDDAFQTTREKIDANRWRQQRYEDGGLAYFSASDKGAIMTLPVPNFRKEYAASDIRSSYLSIELLFEDDIVEPFCKREKVAGGASMLRVRDSKKIKFVDTIKGLDSSRFSGIGLLFDRLFDVHSQTLGV